MSLPFEIDPYPAVQSTWPQSGRHILGTFDEHNIILYQAYNPSIANHAVTHQSFLNCPDYRTTGRMTWLKPNFLWMMYRSGWASKVNQERILAITVTREGFEEIIRNATLTQKSQSTECLEGMDKDTDVRLQWDPDHDPKGEKVARRAIQLGIKRKILERFLTEWIVKIEDITEFVKQQAEFVTRNELDLLQVPKEKVYRLMDTELAPKILLDEYNE
jgi:hypothetical protein